MTGQGCFTADLPAKYWVRFVRSPVASGRIVHVTAPEGARVITAADLATVKPIRPLLHKFNYVPVDQPVLARDVVRFVGEPIAAVLAVSQEEAEDIADRVEMRAHARLAHPGQQQIGRRAMLGGEENPRQMLRCLRDRRQFVDAANDLFAKLRTFCSRAGADNRLAH